MQGGAKWTYRIPAQWVTSFDYLVGKLSLNESKTLNPHYSVLPKTTGVFWCFGADMYICKISGLTLASHVRNLHLARNEVVILR